MPGRRALAVALSVAGLLALAAGAPANTSHYGWPRIDGDLIMHKADESGPITATKRNRHNELLGGHGNDAITGGDVGDVIWGDYKPSGQPRPSPTSSSAAGDATSSTPATGSTRSTRGLGATSCTPTSGAGASTAVPGTTPSSSATGPSPATASGTARRSASGRAGADGGRRVSLAFAVRRITHSAVGRPRGAQPWSRAGPRAGGLPRWSGVSTPPRHKTQVLGRSSAVVIHDRAAPGGPASSSGDFR